MLPPEQTAPELVLANLHDEVYQRKAYLLLRTLIKPVQCCHDREIYLPIPFLEALPRVMSIFMVGSVGNDVCIVWYCLFRKIDQATVGNNRVI